MGSVLLLTCSSTTRRLCLRLRFSKYHVICSRTVRLKHCLPRRNGSVTWCLVCIQLLLDVANGEPIYREPFVMVIASPMASPQGQLSRISDIWPGQSALQPIGYTLDTLDENSDIALATASLHSASRMFTSLKVTSTFDSNLEETIYTLAGIELCKSGFVLTSAPMQSGTEHFYGQSQQQFQRLEVSEQRYLGTGDLQTQLASASH